MGRGGENSWSGMWHACNSLIGPHDGIISDQPSISPTTTVWLSTLNQKEENTLRLIRRKQYVLLWTAFVTTSDGSHSKG